MHANTTMADIRCKRAALLPTTMSNAHSCRNENSFFVRSFGFVDALPCLSCMFHLCCCCCCWQIGETKINKIPNCNMHGTGAQSGQIHGICTHISPLCMDHCKRLAIPRTAQQIESNLNPQANHYSSFTWIFRNIELFGNDSNLWFKGSSFAGSEERTSNDFGLVFIARAAVSIAARRFAEKRVPFVVSTASTYPFTHTHTHTHCCSIHCCVCVVVVFISRFMLHSTLVTYVTR